MFILRVVLLLASLLLCQRGISTPLAPQDSVPLWVYAGIEIGATGVKMTVIRENTGASGQKAIASIEEQSINTNLVSLQPEAVIATAWAVRAFLDTLANVYKIPKKMVFIVMSSGAKATIDKEGKTDEVREAIRYAIDEPGRVLYYIRPDQEAELIARGLIPEAERATAAVLDIGGGNTKGGRFSEAGFHPFSMPYGTRSMLKTVPATDSVPILSRRMDSLYLAKMQAEYTAAAASPALKPIQTLYVSGGIFWIACSFFYPDKHQTPTVEMTLADLKRFREMVVKNYAMLSHPAYNTGLPDAAAIEKMLTSARSTYDRKALTAGAALAYGLVLATSEQQAGPLRIVFDRHSNLSWLRGLVSQSIQTGGKLSLPVL